MQSTIGDKSGRGSNNLTERDKNLKAIGNVPTGTLYEVLGEEELTNTRGVSDSYFKVYRVNEQGEQLKQGEKQTYCLCS